MRDENRVAKKKKSNGQKARHFSERAEKDRMRHVRGR